MTLRRCGEWAIVLSGSKWPSRKCVEPSRGVMTTYQYLDDSCGGRGEVVTSHPIDFDRTGTVGMFQAGTCPTEEKPVVKWCRHLLQGV